MKKPASQMLGFSFAPWTSAAGAASAAACAACITLCSAAPLARAQPAGARADPAAEAEVLTRQGRALIHAGKLEQAREDLRKAARLRGQALPALYELARVEFASGDYRKSRSACKALTDKDANAALSNVCVARTFLVWRRASRAQEYIEKARATADRDPEVLLALADMQRMSGEATASKDSYQQVLALDPNAVDAYFGLGQLYLVTPDAAAAQKAFRQALQREPQWPDAQYELGQLVGGTEAVTLLEQALALRPDWPQARLALGEARLRAGDAAAAEALFREVLKKDSGNALAHARLGMALEAKHDLDLAEKELKLGLAGVSTDADAARTLARVYAQTDRTDDALAQYRVASTLEHGGSRALIEAGVYSLKVSRNALAQAFLEKALERTPRSAQAHARYADVLLARGDKAKAKEHYQLALSGEGELDRAAVQQSLATVK
ncbi:MAG TPA: tetratricopeptide repeat protein [Polyangiales bacterium]